MRVPGTLLVPRMPAAVRLDVLEQASFLYFPPFCWYPFSGGKKQEQQEQAPIVPGGIVSVETSRKYAQRVQVRSGVS